MTDPLRRMKLVLAAAALAVGAALPAGATEYLITDYGAVGNNSTDNAGIINGLIAGLPPEGGGIVIPPGDFRVNSPVVINSRNNVTIRGVNYGQRSNVDPAPGGVAGPAGGSKLIPGTGVQFAIAVYNTSSNISGLIVRDLAIQGGDGNTYQHGIFIDRDNVGTRIMDVSCINLKKGVFIRAATRAVVEDCWLAECESPLHMTGGTDNMVVDSSFGGQSGGIACDLNSQMRLLFSGNVIFPDGNTGILLTQAENCNLTQNTMTGWFTGLVQIDGNMNTFTNNFVSGVLNPAGNWPADPLGRSNTYGLVRVSGNDNTIGTCGILSWQPANDVRVRDNSGDRNVFRDLWIAAYASNRKIYVSNPTTTWARITCSGWNTEVDPGGSSTARVQYDP